MSSNPFDPIELGTPRHILTLATTSQQIVGVNKGRNGWTLQAPPEADIWFNPTGSAAGPTQPGSFLLRAGQSVSSALKAAVTVWCATANLHVNLVEE